MKEKARELLENLSLRGMAEVYDSIIEKAERDAVPLVDSLYELLSAEHHSRHDRSMINRIKRAKLPWDWGIDTFPFEKQPGLQKSQILNLIQLGFMQRHENIVFIGEPGTGKTGLALSIMREALVNGYRCRFYNAQDLLNELYQSLADRSTSKLLKSISRYDLLIIDELGYLVLNDEQVNTFFKLMDMRYGQLSTIITTNLEYSDWYQLFKNKHLTDALLDRLQHHCITIKIEGPSLRQPKKSDDSAPKQDEK